MAIARTERRPFGRESGRIERVVLGLTGPLLFGHVVLALTILTLLYALLLLL